MTPNTFPAPAVNLDRDLRADLQAALAEHGKWVSYPTAAEIIGVSVRSLKRETAGGSLPCFRIGRTKALRVKTEDLFALVERVA